MRTKSLLFSVILLCLSTFKAFSQFETTLPSMRGLYQSSYINPAFTPEYKFSVGLPVTNNIGLRLNMYGIDLNTISSSIDPDSNYLDLNVLYDKLDGPIGFNIPYQADLFYFRFPIKGYYIGINNTMKTDATIYIAKEFIGFLSQGNDFFIGKNQDYELLKIKTDIYNETGLSLSKEYKRFSFGMRVKYLKGIANVQTTDVKMLVNTSNTLPYSLTLRTSGNIQTAGLPLNAVQDSINGQPIDTADTKFDASKYLQAGNDGWGFDFGLTYQFSTRLSAWASVVDFGSSITWDHQTYNYKLDESNIEFGGLNYDQATDNSQMTQLIDSLSAKLGDAYVTYDSYKTVIPTKYYAGIDFDLSLRDRIGGMFQGLEYLGKFNTAYTFNYMHRFFRNTQVTSNLSLINNKNMDFGFGTTTKFGPIQFFFYADNLMSVVKPSTSRNIYFRLGIQLVLGQVHKTKKLFL